MENQEDSIESEFGTTSYEAEQRHRRLKLRQPDIEKGETTVTTIVRILPPMKSYRDKKGINYAFFRSTHWGWTTVNPANPERKVWLPYQSTAQKDAQKNYIPGSDPGFDKIKSYEDQVKRMEVEARKAEDEAAKAEGRSARSDKDLKKDLLLKQEYQEAKSYLKQYTLKKGWVLAVVDLEGNPCELTLSSKTFFKLKELLDGIRTGKNPTLAKRGVTDPLALENGIWIKFTTTGNNTSKSDEPSVYSETVDHPELGAIEVPKSGVLSKEVLKRALELLPDISIPVGAKLTVEEVKELVNGPDEPERVAKIFKCEWTLSKPESSDNQSDDTPF